MSQIETVKQQWEAYSKAIWRGMKEISATQYAETIQA